MATILVCIVFLILYFNLSSRINRLEELSKNKILPQGSVNPIAAAINTQSAIVPTRPVAVTLNETSGEDSFDRFGNWLKDDWLLKFGILLLLIGFGWFTTYAFAHNWIGPMGRIALGIMAGAAFLILGNWRIKNFLHQGGAFLVLGSTTILLTIFAAREVYDFFTPTTALIVMFLSTSFVAFASVKYNNRPLALASLILAGIAPLLTNSPAIDYVGLFAYLLIVIIGALWVTALTGRRELTTAALILVAFYSLPHLMGFASGDKGTLLLFAYAFSSLFFLTNVSALLKSKKDDMTADILTAAGNGLFLLVWILTAAQHEWKSLIISAWMIVFAIGSYLIYKFNNQKEAFYTYASLGIAMLAVATSVELNGASLTIAYTIESGIISFIIYSILKDIRVATTSTLLLFGPIILSVNSWTSQSWNLGAINQDFFVLLILGIVTAIVGGFFWNKHREVNDKEVLDIGPTFIKISSIYAFGLIWKILHAVLVNDDTAVMVSLVIYTIVGITTYFYGKLNDNKSFRAYGGVLLGCVIGRLFIVDVWKMELAGRITTFFLLGALLVSTAFIGRKNKDIETVNKI